ncbi:35040_t:CDS:2, partial [Racocetra persica]
SEGEELIIQIQQFDAQLSLFDFLYVSVSNIMSYEENQIRDDETSSDTFNSSTILLINKIVDLKIEEHSKSPVAETAQAVLSEDLDYNLSDVLNSFLECEKQN